jgi:hypothetical protein
MSAPNYASATLRATFNVYALCENDRIGTRGLNARDTQGPRSF